MNKKILSKTAALSMAAVAAISAMSMTVSADVVYSITDKTISGTAVLATANVSYTTKTHYANKTENATTGKIAVTFSSQDGNAPTIVDENTELKYSTSNTVKTEEGNNYFASSKAANGVLANIKAAVTYENKYSTNGTDAVAAWKDSWTAYVKYYNTKLEYTNKKTYDDKNGTNTATAYYNANKEILDNELTEPTAVEKVQWTYSSITNTQSVTMTALQNKFGEAVTIDNATGVIETGISGNDWTISLSGSSDSGTTDDSTIETWYPTSASYRVPTTTGYSYLGENGKFYTSEAAANLYGGGWSGKRIVTNYSSLSNASAIYFNANDGYYYTSSAAAGVFSYLVYGGSYYSSDFGSYKAANGMYYPTIIDAQNASYAYNRTYTYSVISTTAKARYFSMVTGNFYDSYSAALAAAPSYSSSYVIDLSTYTGGSSTSTNYYDPYYWYFMYGNYGNNSSSSSVAEGSPTIYGSSRRAGWNTILRTVKTSKTGATVKIDMNDAETIPESILDAAKSNGVTIKAVMDNGATWTIKGSDVNSVDDSFNASVTYNTKVVPTSLVNKAKRVNSDVVSTAQIYVSDNGGLGLSGDLTVKLSSKRSGCTVKAYRYTSSGSLRLADKALVQSNGSVTFDVSNGGAYLLVVMD